MKIVFDIETSGCEFEELADSQKEYLLRYAEKESDEVKKNEMIQDAKRYLSLYPLTSKVVSVGMLNTETKNSLVLFESNSYKENEIKDEKLKYIGMSEVEMIEHFWSYVKKTEALISFNGRLFDLPFLMLRSAILKIKPSRNFLKNRYDSTHIDLLERLTFWNSTRKFNLDFYCHSFGIASPKSEGITGMEIKELYKAGKVEEIATYCHHDVKATYELYKIWNDYLDF